MSNTANKISEDIKTAMKARDTAALTTLRALKSALTNVAIEKGVSESELSEQDTLATIRKQIKQRQDSIEQFETAGRAELAASEKAEMEILSRYLPAALTAEELDAIVTQAITETEATSRADMGKAMKRAQELADGRADGKELSSAVMKKLS